MGEFSYSDLVAWAKERLAGWQQDALRRLVENSTLSSEDIEELTDIALAAHVADSGAPAPVPPPENKEFTEAAHPCVKLASVRNIERVNALASGPVMFGLDGLTVIYGANASGKSGVVRILKKSCHARDPGGTVLPNVFEADPREPASASVDFIVDSGARSHDWVDGARRRDPFLRTVNVFDSRCAAVQVEKAYRVSYTPEILQVFRSLASATDSVADALRAKKTALGTRPAALSALSLNSETEAGKFMVGLSGRAQMDVLKRLCTLSEGETARIGELDRALADNPLRRATAEDARARLVRALAETASRAETLLSDEACSTLEGLLAERSKTQEAAAVAREAFAENSDLTEVGSDVWRTLWESARRYSETHAYTGEIFPVVREGAVCVLCQQELSPKARTRLHSFEEFIQADVQRKADRAAAKLMETVAAVKAASLPGSVRRALREAGILDLPVGDAARRFLTLAKVRRRQLLKVVGGGRAAERPVLSATPDLAVIHRQIKEEVGRLQAVSSASERQAMEKERAELKAREALSPHVETVRGEIERLRKVAELDCAIEECKTQPITLKRREAAASVLTDRLRSNFQGNLLRLGFAESPVEVKLGAGEHGEHPVELKLIARPEVRPEEVLSEGERTCVALAGLLAELDTTGNRSALVLDDPVSSLDHQYRKRVAERLVRESSERQVLVFTHDIVFLYLLRKYQVELGVELSEVSLERGYKKDHGRAKSGPPWAAMSVKDRIKILREDLLEARRLLKEGNRTEYERRASEVYKRLRMCWERAVEEVLLNQTVVRFGDAVQTRRLAKLTDISDADVEHVTREMSRCSDFEHDESGAVHADLAEPDVVEADIRKLDNWVKELRTKRGRS